MAADSAVLFDLGGTHLRCACLRRRNDIGGFQRERIRSFREGLSASEIWGELIDKMATYAMRSSSMVDKSASLVLSFPGPIQEDGSIVNAPTVCGDADLPDLRAELTRRTGRTVHVLNDVSAAALYLAQECEWNRFMVITISSGIGSKTCFRDAGRLALFDKGPYAGEIGHLTIDESESAPVCDCGGRGHLGAISSGRGIEDLARRRANAEPTEFSRSLCCTKFGATTATLSNEDHLVPAVRAGDSWTLRVLREGTRPLAFVLNTAVLTLGLQGILVIGGFAFGIGDTYLQMLSAMIQDRCSYSALRFSSSMIRFGNMCDEACLRGAAEYALMIRTDTR